MHERKEDDKLLNPKSTKLVSSCFGHNLKTHEALVGSFGVHLEIKKIKIKINFKMSKILMFLVFGTKIRKIQKFWKHGRSI